MQRFISTSLIIALLGLIILWAGCGGGKRAAMVQQRVEKKSEETIDVPEWFLNLPEDPNYLYSPTTATSKDLQLAIDMEENVPKGSLRELSFHSSNPPSFYSRPSILSF